MENATSLRKFWRRGRATVAAAGTAALVATAVVSVPAASAELTKSSDVDAAVLEKAEPIGEMTAVPVDTSDGAGNDSHTDFAKSAGRDPAVGPALEPRFEHAAESDVGGPISEDHVSVGNWQVASHAHSFDVSFTTSQPVKWVGVQVKPFDFPGPTKVGLGLSSAPKTSWTVTVPQLSPGTRYQIEVEVPTASGPVIAYVGLHSTV